MTQIANPIYDAVFKFMMNDNNVAKLLLSAIIGQNIIQLSFHPTELHIPIQDSITVFRMDFKAIILLEDGSEKTTIIEIQKAKLHTDIMRFRKYLGEQYQDKNNSKIVKKVESKKEEGIWIEHRKAFPILSIYFLGHRLDHIKDVPVIKVARSYYDLGTGQELTQREHFIESLTHDSYIIQIPYIKGHRRTELEQLLQIFDQSGAGENGIQHILTVKEEEIPALYQPIVRRLLTAIADAKTRKSMQVEDEILDEFRQYTRALAESQKVIKDKEKVIEDKEKVIEDNKKVIEDKEKMIEDKEKSIKQGVLKFISLGLSNQEIVNVLNVSIEVVEQLRKENSNN